MVSNSLSVYTKIYIPFVLGFTILFTILVSRPVFSSYTDREAEIVKLEKKMTDATEEADALATLQKQLTEKWDTSEIKKKVLKYNHPYNEADIMEMVMVKPPQTQPNPDSTYNLIVKSFSIEKGKHLPSGLSLGNVSVSIEANSVDTIVSYLTYLTQNSPMAFTIDQITLPIDTRPDGTDKTQWLSLTLTLGIYYFD